MLGPYRTSYLFIYHHNIINCTVRVFLSEIEACIPNPCQHGGICLTNEDRSFTCNCSGTMYSGETCDNGIISIPNYPQFTINTSYTFSVKAKPDEDLVLALIRDDTSSIVVNPLMLTFTKAVPVNNFTIFVNKSGLFKLSYKLTGASSSKYELPQPSNIIVLDNQTTETDYFAENGLQKGILPAGCCTSTLEYKCQSYLNDVKFTATCPWNNKGNYSAGIVFSSNNGFAFPIAISGVKFGSRFGLSSLSRHELKSHTCKVCEQYLSRVNEDFGILSKTKCYKSKPSTHPSHIHSFLNLETLAHTFFYHAHQLIPQWLRFNVTSTDRVHDANSYMVTLVESSDIETLKSCHIMKAYSKGLYSVLVYSGKLNITVNSEKAFYQPNLHPVCFAVSLCEGTLSPVYISIPDDSTNLIHNFRFMDIFRKENWHISVNSVVITNGIMPLAVSGTYWNGVDNFDVSLQQINLVLNGEITYSFTHADFNIYYEFVGEIYLYTNEIDKV